MKKMILIFFLLLSIVLKAQDTKVINSFKKIVQTYENFFSEPRYQCVCQLSSSPYDGELNENNSIRIYYADKIKYDAEKTESILSPYYGYIEVEYNLLTNAYATPDYIGYNTMQEAFSFKDSLDRYGSPDESMKSDKFNFAYIDGRWELRSVNTLDGDPSDTGFFIGIPYRLYKASDFTPAEKINQQWLILDPSFKMKK